MKAIILTFVLFLSSSITLAPSAHANPQALGTCFLDSLTGKERKLLVRWIFFSMASHPELNNYINLTKDDTDDTDKGVGALITRLFVENCPAEATAAQKADPLAIQKAFELVGQVAMQEIMANQAVMSSISNYIKYADQNKINALFAE